MRLKKYYPWIVAAVALLQMAIYGGSGNTLNSVHLIPVSEALGLSRTAFSLGGSLKAMTAVVGTLLSGTMMAKYGYRKMVVAGMLISGFIYLMFAGTNSYWLLLVNYAALGFTGGVCGTAGGNKIVTSWFHRRRGTVLGLVTAATGIGGSVVGVVQTAVIQGSSWRSSYLLVAACMAVVAILIFLLVRDRPEELNMAPYGAGTVETSKKVRKDHWDGFTLRQLVRRPTFYLMIVATFIANVAIYLAFSYILSHLRDRGLTQTQAGTVNSVMLLGLTGVKFLAGAMCDLIGAKRVTVLCAALGAVGLVMLTMVNSFGFGVAAALMYVLVVPLSTVTIPLLTGELFGFRDHTQLTGIFLSAGSVATIIAGPISNTVQDLTGSYSPAFYAGALMAVLSVGLHLVLYRLADRDRAKQEAGETI